MEKQLRLKFLTDEGIVQLKANFNSNIDKYLNNNHEYFLNYLEENNYLIESKYIIDDFTDKLQFTGITDLDDFENTKLMYDSMKNLPDYIMMDDRLWAAITHTFMWDYIQKRRHDEAFNTELKDYQTKIYNSFFTHTKHGKKRGTFVNCVSRLWWAGRLSYDNENPNHYELSEELFKKGFASTIVPFSSSNIMGREESRKAFLAAIKEIRMQGIDVKRDDISFGLRYLNLIAGSSLLDIMDYNEIKESVINYYKDYYKNEDD